MAQHESDREDLMRDATALKRRIELRYRDENGTIIAGFRNGGAWSIYFDQDPVYHFDRNGRLRRAFVDGFLFRSQKTTLGRLRRVRSIDRTELVRHDLADAELAVFRSEMKNRLDLLARAIRAGELEIVSQVPDGVDIVGDLASAVDKTDTPEWLAPSLKGKP